MVTGAKIRTVTARTYAISSKRERPITILGTIPGRGLGSRSRESLPSSVLPADFSL